MSSRSESVMFLTSADVMPSGGFLIYFCLSSSTNFESIVRLQPVDVFSMGQTEDKIKHICHWSGNDILPLSFRIVQEEKQAYDCGRVPETPFCGYTLDIEEGRNQRIRERADAIY